MRQPALVLACLVWACGSSGDDEPADAGRALDAADDQDASADAGDAGADAGTGDPSDPLDPLVPIVGVVSLTESPSGPWASDVRVVFMDGPWMPVMQVLVAEEGACAFYEAVKPPFCDPACGDGFRCGLGGTCVPYNQRVSAGLVTIETPDWTATAAHEETNWYTVEGAPQDDLFDAGDAIVVSAEGDQIDPFEVRLRGVGTIGPSLALLTLTDGQDNVVTFTPQGDGARIELILQSGWHGAPPEAAIWCHGDDADGEIRIPQALVERFPQAGGVGLLPHPSILRRVHRRLLDGPFGLIELVAASELTFDVLH